MKISKPGLETVEDFIKCYYFSLKILSHISRDDGTTYFRSRGITAVVIPAPGIPAVIPRDITASASMQKQIVDALRNRF